MSIHEIRAKVLSIPESVFYVVSADGRNTKVTQRGDDVFEFFNLLGEIVTLHSLGDVFDYLGTPENRRQKRISF